MAKNAIGNFTEFVRAKFDPADEDSWAELDKLYLAAKAERLASRRLESCAAGQAIIEYLIEANLSRRQFAALMGISPRTLDRLISGERALPGEEAIMIENITNGQLPRQKLRPDLWPFHVSQSAGVA